MNIKSNILILIFLSILLCYCSSGIKQESESNDNEDITTSLYYQIIGKWVSNDDSNTMLVIDNRTLRNYYNNMLIDSGFYSFNKTILNSEEIFSLAVTYSKGDTLFYEIENITDSTLTLLYMARGNNLIYRRIGK